MPPDMLTALPGYDPDVQKNRAEARRIMNKLGYGPDNRLKVKLTVRDLPYLRDPAVLLIDQPRVRGFTIMVNSIFNGGRMEDVWLDK